MLTDGFFPDVVGGISKSVLSEAEGLISRGHKVIVFSRTVETGNSGVEKLNSITVRRHPSIPRGSRIYHLYPLWILFYVCMWTRRIVEKEKIQVIHVHHPFAMIALVLSGISIPVVYTFHAPFLDEVMIDARYGKYKLPFVAYCVGIIMRQLEKICFRHSDRIVCMSLFTADILRQKYSLSGRKISIIPLGIDKARYRILATEKSTLRQTLDLPLDRFLLLTVRRLEGRMGLDRLIAAIAQLERTDASLTRSILLLVAGRGYLHSRLRTMIREAGIEHSVVLLGFVPEESIVELYNAVDLFILPTQALEGFGLSTLEALACGLPVIGTPIGATHEIIEKISPALLFDGASSQEIARGLEQMLRSGIDWDRLGRTGRDVVESFYSSTRVANALEIAYDEVVSKRNAAL